MSRIKFVMIALYLSAILAIYPAVANCRDDSIRTSNPPRRLGWQITFKLDEQVLAATEALETTHSRIAYLASVTTGTKVVSQRDNDRKSTAMRLLGIIGTTATLPVLMDNIDFYDTTNKSYPAQGSICRIGKPAVPHLLKFIEQSERDSKNKVAAETVMFIIGDLHQREFLRKQKEKLPPKVYDYLKKVVY